MCEDQMQMLAYARHRNATMQAVYKREKCNEAAVMDRINLRIVRQAIVLSVRGAGWEEESTYADLYCPEVDVSFSVMVTVNADHLKW